MHRFSPIIRLLKNQNEFLILSHQKPDGDAIGSSLALALFLKRFKKDTVEVVLPHTPPEIYKFLPSFEIFKLPKDIKGKRFEVGIVLDASEPQRLGDAEKLLSRVNTIVQIDHHVGTVGFGDYNYINEETSSVAEIIYKIIQLTGSHITKEIAICLFVGIATDTGFFRQKNTTPEALSIAAELIKFGIQVNEIYSQIYQNFSFSMMKLIGKVLANLTSVYDGKVIYCWVTKEDYNECNIEDSEFDSELLFSYIRMIKNAEVFVVFRELDKEKVRVNLRSNKLEVLSIAERYGGGGHALSCGLTIEKPLGVCKKMIIEDIKRII